MALSSLFLDRVVDVTEERHYPALPPARSIPVAEAAGAAARLLGASLLLNILALPVYFVPLLNLPVWLLINGFLIGREYAELIGLRRVDRRTLEVLRGQQRAMFWLSGAVIALLLALPLVNLVAPIVGAAFMTHRFHRYCDETALRVPRAA